LCNFVFFQNIVNYCVALPKANSTSILLFLTAVVVLRINKCIRISFNRYPIEFPMEVFLILGFTAFANKINMATENSRTLIDMIPYSFLFPVMPDLNILHKIILEAFSLALVSSSLLIFVGKKIASVHNYHVNSNQDLIAIGLCNVVSSFFRSCVFTGAVIRTIIQNKSGGRQQFASLVGAGVMLLLIVKVGHFFYKLPNAVVAGVILTNILPYLETIYNLPNLWRQNQYDCVSVGALAKIIWMVTFISAIFLGLDVGLLISVAFVFFVITVRSHRTKVVLLGQIRNTNIYRSLSDYPEVTNIPGVKIFQCCNSITFVNVYHLKHKLLKEVRAFLPSASLEPLSSTTHHLYETSPIFQIEMVRVPLKEEEVFSLFNRNEAGFQEEKICRCFCNRDELEPPARIVYTERFESKQDHDTSSINLIRCSRFKSMDMSQATADDQEPYIISSTSQRTYGENCEEVEKTQLPKNPSRKVLMALRKASENQGESSLPVPHSEVSLPPSTHTIILDFSMVHFVDSQASVILRQMCNAFQNANILVLISGCHSSVVRAFERNDFFDAGITKAQLFLTLHDAVLFALSRKFPESSELSLDESETAIQETYSETDKNEESSHNISSSLLGIPKNVSPGFSTVRRPVTEEEPELDMDLESMLESEQETGLDLDLHLDHNIEPESELEPETEVEAGPQLKSTSRPKNQSYPLQQYWPVYQSMPPNSPPEMQHRTRSVEGRHQPMNLHPSKGNEVKDP
ncbi:hypothetical protein MC885_021568, partial [Smutsia gigantea]